jgi:hypothetical protein
MSSENPWSKFSNEEMFDVFCCFDILISTVYFSDLLSSPGKPKLLFIEELLIEELRMEMWQ